WTRDLMRGTHRAIEAYTAKCATLDRPVEVTTPNGATLSGIATQLAKDGSLVIDTGEGLVVVSAGDVVHASLA
ncbi:MAG: BirA family biotin operon repressor/biotin-[acetyl-CoA-carboxylase] ligase, partial [Glaciecola sp.]